MGRHRNASTPFTPTKALRWWVVRNRQGAILEARPLPGGVDLLRIFVEALLERLNDGWRLGEFSSTAAVFFCDRGLERQMVSIDPTDPHNVPMYGAAHFAGGQ